MGVETSPELYINMKRKPKWNDLYSWEDQDDDVRQFFKEEAYKVKNGVTINGVYITPWLYWHINFFPVFHDLPNGDRVPMLSRLRDNEWFFAEMYQRAREEKKGLAMFGTRRFGKALLDSEVVWTERGPVKIGHIGIGDEIYGDDGKLCEVKGVYPQGKVDTYRIVFEDGRSVICCGKHIWRVKLNGEWRLINMESIVNGPYERMRFGLCSPIDFKGGYWPAHPSFIGMVCCSYLKGEMDIFPDFPQFIRMSMLMSSIEDRANFIRSFIENAVGTITGRDRVRVERMDYDVIHFVSSIFWSMGYFCSLVGNELVVSNIDDTVSVRSIDVHKRARCTCIEVDNRSHQFVTTDFVPTHNTTIMSSVLQMNATMTIGLSHSVVGFSDSDLANIGEYTEFGLDHVHPFFRINRTTTNWSSGVVLGKRMANNTRKTHAIISISNINMGKMSATQKTAGLTPYTAIFDEIGKGPIKKPFTAAIPSYDTPYGWRVSPILAGTGGEVELSQDAQEILADPESYNLITMDWSLLDRRAGKGKTWKERKWGMFVPGQMSHSSLGCKREMGLDEYLGKPKGGKLSRIRILATDFEESTRRINAEREELSSKDRVAYTSNIMFYPLKIDDCFLNTASNKFPVDLAIKHKNDLLESNRRHGLLAEVFLESGNKLGYKESMKPLAGYPFKGGVIDSPVQIFELPVSNKFDDYIYVAGLDFYKQAKSSTDSLGAFYIFKRRVGIRDPYAQRIVASYVARPSSIDHFCSVCEILQRGYGAVCLMENADQMYEQYLNRKSGMSADFFLFPGEAIVNSYVKIGGRQNSRLGLSPTQANQNLIFSSVIDYCWQEFVVGYDDMTGMDIKVRGVELIDDIGLLDEIIQYDGSKNVDRIITFGHALVLARYYDDNNYLSKSKVDELNEERKKDARSNPEVYASAFSSIRLGAF